MMRRRQASAGLEGWKVGIVATVAALGVPGCADPPPRQPGDRATVRVAVRPLITYAPLYIAEQRGFFDAQGIDVELVNLEASPQGIPLLLSGDLDVLPAPLSPGFLHAISSGEGIRFVADKGWVDPEGCAFVGLVGRPDAFERRSGSGVGQSLRVSLPRDAQLRFFVDRALRERFGLASDDAAVEGFNIPDNAELVAFLDGALDGALMSGPTLLAATDIDGVELLAGIQDVLPGYQFSMVTFGPRLRVDDPDLGRRFMVAYLQGVRAYREGKTPENVAALAAATGLGASDLTDSCWMPIRPDGVANIETLRDYIDWYMMKGWLESAPDLEELWDQSFVDYANQRIDTEDTVGGE